MNDNTQTQAPAFKLSDAVLKSLSGLDDATRERATKMVKTHIAACLRHGAPIENLERVFVEAIDLVKREPAEEPVALIDPVMYEPARIYHAYVSPRV